MEVVAQDPNFKGKYITRKRWSPPSPLDEIPVEGIKGTPMFDLSRVKIYWPGSSWPGEYFMYGDEEGTERQHLEIYGHILLIDDKGNEFALFHRDFNDAEKVPLDIENTNITITLEKFQFESPRCLPATFCLVFYLKETFQDTFIANQVKFIDITTTELAYAYDQKHEFDFSTDFAYVTVEYTILQCALLACVGLVIEKVGENETPESDDDLPAEMTGTLNASFMVRDGSSFEYVLSKSHSFPNFGNFTKLSIFGVPAYSWLYIKANVNVNGDKFESPDKYLEFDPDDTYKHIPYEKELVGQRFRLRILVKWGHATFFLREARLCEWLDRSRSKVKEDRNWEEGEEKSITSSRLIEKCQKRLRYINQENFQLISILPRLEALRNRNWIMSSFPYMWVEVFSISVCSYRNGNDPVLSYGNGSTTLGLYGTISVKHSNGDLQMFYRAKTKPKHLRSYEPIPLKSSFDRCIGGPHFTMKIDLKDIERDEICNGFVAYDFVTVRNWLNKRLCSIVRGESGFATVHHTIFSDAVQAKLKFILKSNSGDSIKGRAFGRINGRYGNFRYDTHYEKKFFQSTLFDKSEARPVKIVGSEIPLSKYVVAVPLNGALVVTAHIFVLTEGGCETVKYTYEATFKCTNREDSKILSNKIQGSNLSLSMFVEWK